MTIVSVPASEPAGLPVPSAELVLLRVHVEALIMALGRKRAEKYLRACSEIFATEQSLAGVLNFRPMEQQAELAVARKNAAFWWRQALPLFISRIPPP